LQAIEAAEGGFN